VKRVKRAPKAAPDSTAGLPRADHEPLGPGDVVMLPDGGMAAIEKIVGTDAYVIEWQKQSGRGPWIFPISELVPVT
jgi:hypothetical protein